MNVTFTFRRKSKSIQEETTFSRFVNIAYESVEVEEGEAIQNVV